jgi:EmrB/QacA subfamily drug resistance transporter
MGGLGVAVGPLVGGAVVQGGAWQWIFWLNVPIGLAVLPFAWRGLAESYGARTRVDLPGVALATAGLGGLVYGVIRANAHGWTSAGVLAPIVAGSVLIVAFGLWERRTDAPMLPLALFRDRSFAAVNAASFLFSFGMFGAIFLLAQSLQLVYGYGPLGAGLRTLPWTAMPLLVAPVAGPLADRIGGRPLIATGLTLMAGGLTWMALLVSVGGSYPELVAPFVLAGVGMALFFVPVGTVVFASAPEQLHGVASGTNNAIRELGGVFGIAVLSSVFATFGGYDHPRPFVDGLRPATLLGAGIVVLGVVAALLIARHRSVAGPAETADVTVQPPVGALS